MSVSKCLYLLVLNFTVASFAVNDCLDVTWHARKQTITTPLGDFGDPNVLDSLFQVLVVCLPPSLLCTGSQRNLGLGGSHAIPAQRFYSSWGNHEIHRMCQAWLLS